MSRHLGVGPTWILDYKTTQAMAIDRIRPYPSKRCSRPFLPLFIPLTSQACALYSRLTRCRRLIHKSSPYSNFTSWENWPRPLTNARSSFDEPFLDESGVSETLSSGYQVRRLKCLLCISWASALVLAIALVVLFTRLRYTTSTAIFNDEVYCTLIRSKYSLLNHYLTLS